jgi:hypothetical protein
MWSVNRMRREPDVRSSVVRWWLLYPAFCLLLPAFWLLPLAARADIGLGESELFTLDNASCAQSAVFAIDNGNCAESVVFAIDNRYAGADFDQDGDVDSADFALFRACFSGPQIAYSGACAKADFEHDGDVDQADFGIFLRCFSGAGKSADPSCATEAPLVQNRLPPPLNPGDQNSR